MKTILTHHVFDAKIGRSVAVEFLIEIDAARTLRVIGGKAYRNKSRKSQEIGGAVVVSVQKVDGRPLL